MYCVLRRHHQLRKEITKGILQHQAPGKNGSSASRKRAGKRDEILEIVERIHSGKRGGLREIMIAPSGQSLIFDKKTSNT